jgi:UDP-N-acetylmuramyl tripeptide synthase
VQLGIAEDRACQLLAKVKPAQGRLQEILVFVKAPSVFVDFAHNPHSISAVAKTMAAIPAKRRFVMLSHAGDRSDKDIQDVTVMALSLNPDVVVATELPSYLRGRQLGEIPSLIRQTCLAQGMPADHILTATSPSDAVAQILAKLQPGDLALLLALSERDEIFEMLKS